MKRLFFASILSISILAQPATGSMAPADGSWLQWGGPGRNFVVNSPPLADSWPEGGPPRLWDRSLGEGHSAILVEGNRLYTMYRYAGWLSMLRRSQSEIIAALDATTARRCGNTPTSRPPAASPSRTAPARIPRR
jgi:hypothetical protein